MSDKVLGNRVMSEYYVELITDALHLSHDQGQISDEDYKDAIVFVENGFADPSKE